MIDPDQNTRWELTLIEKVIGFVVIGILGWMAFTIQHMTVDVAVIKTELANGNRDRFTGQEGKALTERVERLEERLKTVEERSTK